MRYIPEVPATEDDWSTRHSVLTTARRAAALVNVLADDRPDPGEVAAVLLAHGETGPLALDPREVAGMRAAAALLREVFAAATADEAAAVLNRLLREHTGPLRLTSHGGTGPWHAHVDRDDDAPWAEWLLASSCMALAVLLWDRQRPPGRTCASGGCRNVFVARGSGPERRYCSRRCATRERVAAHRGRHSGGPVEGPA
ncbi:CGNR zinc finger domain-containing protein [Streptomyces sp. NK15101]|uniref:CGNR zinc finger domain-containing protein n=1 Tax=Streptomyces sp. NK15101 TaxID=2873261 RepID=UPI001CECF1D6|nr:CGNR zinc finger domain-containing protein [Streptomyces sp. NK15101]